MPTKRPVRAPRALSLPPARAAPQEPVTVRTHGMSTDARAIARLPSEKIAFIEGALADEVVTVRIEREKASYAEARLLDVETPSPARRTPPCAAARAGCGGCQLQHVDESHQVALKRGWLLETLRRVGHWDAHALEGAQSRLRVVAAQAWAYRQRVRVHFDGVSLGFRRRGSHAILDLDACPIAHPRISGALPALRDLLRAAIARADRQGVSRRTMPGEPSPGLHAEIEISLAEASASTNPSPSSGRLAYELVSCGDGLTKSGVKAIEKILRAALSRAPEATSATDLCVAHPHLPAFKVHRRGFVQPHLDAVTLYVNEVERALACYLKEHEAALRAVTMEEPLRAWDLYAGSGVFTSVPAEAGRAFGFSVCAEGVEGIAPAIEALRRNHAHTDERDLLGSHASDARTAPPRNVVHGRVEDVKAFIARHAQAKSAPHVILLDPPRTGAGRDVMEGIADVLAQARHPVCVVYIACDAASLARDGASLLAAQCTLTDLSMFDCFGQTSHYECIAVFTHTPSPAG